MLQTRKIERAILHNAVGVRQCESDRRELDDWMWYAVILKTWLLQNTAGKLQS